MTLKTVDNTLGAMAHKRLIIKPHRGMYSLSPKQLQEFESKDSLPMAENEEPKSIEGTRITELPDEVPQETSGTSHNYQGEKVGNLVTPSCDNRSDIFTSREIETNPKSMLQGSGHDIADI